MALTTYRSLTAITNKNQRDAAYDRIKDALQHCKQPSFDLTVSRIELMPDNFIEIDFSGPLPNAEQIAHLGLQ